MSELKLCVNCTYILTKQPTYSERCFAPNNISTDLVTGGVLLEIDYCSSQRSGKFSGTCGKEGKWFVSKTTNVVKPIGFFGSLLKRFTK